VTYGSSAERVAALPEQLTDDSLTRRHGVRQPQGARPSCRQLTDVVGNRQPN
jgi:hypothetical protein